MPPRPWPLPGPPGHGYVARVPAVPADLIAVDVPPKGFAPLARVQCQGTREDGGEQAHRHALPQEKLL